MTTEQQQFVAQLVKLKHQAADLGLFRTMQALEHPIKEVGWELAIIAEPGQAKLRDRYMKEAHV